MRLEKANHRDTERVGVNLLVSGLEGFALMGGLHAQCHSLKYRQTEVIFGIASVSGFEVVERCVRHSLRASVSLWSAFVLTAERGESHVWQGL